MKGTKEDTSSLEGASAKYLADRWGFPFREAHTLSIDPTVLEILDREESKRLRVLPLEHGPDGPIFAVAEPSEERFAAVRDIAGQHASFVIVSKDTLDALLNSKVFNVSGGGRRASLFRSGPHDGQRNGFSRIDEHRQEEAHADVHAAEHDAQPQEQPQEQPHHEAEPHEQQHGEHHHEGQQHADQQHADQQHSEQQNSEQPQAQHEAGQHESEHQDHGYNGHANGTGPMNGAETNGGGSSEALDQLLNQIAAGTGTLRAQVDTLTESLEVAQRELREANEQLAQVTRTNENHDDLVTGLRTEVESLRGELERSTALNASMTARLEDVVRALAPERKRILAGLTGLAPATGRPSRLRAGFDRLRSEAGVGLIEVVVALALFAIASTALTDVLTSSVNAHGFATQQSLGQEAADAQIEDIRSLPYDSVGTVSGNPGGSVIASQPASALGVAKLDATVATSIHYVGDGIPGGYNQLTNYKEISVTVTRTSDSRVLSTETTYIAPPTRAPYGGINQVALGVTVTDIGNNTPIPDVPIALSTGPSAPRGDTTDTNGGVLFAGMTANPTSGSTMYYNVAATLPTGYLEMAGDVTQAQLAPGQLSTLTIRAYQPATIYVNLTKNGSPYTGTTTVTVTAPSGSAQSYTISGGSGSIPNLIPNGQYTVTATTSDGMISAPVTQSVPNDYPDDLTSTFNVALTRPNGTMSVTATNGGVPVAGVLITVSGGPDGVTLTATTDTNGVANFPSVPAGTPGYTVSGTYGAAAFQAALPAVVTANQPTPVTLGVPAGSVAVSVKSGATAVPGATVTLTGPNSFTATGITDGTGSYSFPNVGSGSGYSVTATKGAASITQNSISVTNTTATNVAINLNVGTIKVTVTNSSSNPVSGAAVTLTGPNALSVIGTTDASGTYTFTAIGAGGGYSVSASSGAASISTSSVTVTLASTTNVPLTLPTGSVQTTVTLGGSALSGASVTITGPGSFSATGTTNGSGVYTFTGVGAGAGYTVSATYGPATVQQTSVTVTAGSTTNVPIAITTGSVKVTVTAGATPIASAAVTLTGTSYTATPGTTNASGVYTFTNVPVGSGYTAGATFGTASATQGSLSVASGNTTNASVVLPTGTIKATVTVGGTGLAGQQVTATSGTYSVNATTDASGVATFGSAPVGTGYTVSTNYGGTVQQTGVAVTSGATTNVPLTVATGSLKVTVKNQSSTALQGVTVTLGSTNGITAPSGTTNSSGIYTFTNLPVATGYTATATYGPATTTSPSQAITNGSTTNVALTINTGIVTVTTKNQTNANLAGVSLTLNGSNSFSATGTSAAGTYSFTNVPVGSGYTVAYAYGAATGTSANQTVSSGATTTVALSINTGSVNATVTVGGTGVNGATVTLSGSNGFSTTAATNPSGTAAFTNVPAGAGYTSSVSVGAANVTSSTTTVTTGAAANAPLVVPVGSIQVTTKGNSPGCAAQANKTVNITGPNSWSASHSSGGPGVYIFTNVPAGSGTYAVAVAGDVTVNVTVTAGGTATATLSPSGTCP